MITVHDLAIRVGARLLMSDVSFQITPGDKVGLVGRNGAGKTTLTKVLSGTLDPSEGSVELTDFMPVGVDAPKPRISGRTTRYRCASCGTHLYHAALLSALPCNRRIVPGVHQGSV